MTLESMIEGKLCPDPSEIARRSPAAQQHLYHVRRDVRVNPKTDREDDTGDSSGASARPARQMPIDEEHVREGDVGLRPALL